MKVPFASAQKDEDSKKIVDDNENEVNEKIEEVDGKISDVKPNVTAVIKEKVEKCVEHQKKTCCLLPQNCRVLQAPVTQKIVEVVKSRFN